MGLLPDNYWNTPVAQPTPTPQPAADSAQSAAPENQPAPVDQASLNLFGQENPTSSAPVSTAAQAPKQYNPGLGYLIPNALGFDLPDPETFQSMTPEQKAVAYAAGTGNAIKKMITSLPSAIAGGLGSVAATGVEGVRGIVAGAKRGFTVSPERALADEEQANLGGAKTDIHTTFNLGPLGEAPSWFKTYDDAIKSGAGPLAASLAMGGKSIGDMTILGGITESIGNLARPKPGTIGAPVTDLQPIKQAIYKDGESVKFAPKADSANEYYNTTPAVAKQYGGNPGTIKVKLSPVGDGTMDASIVKIGRKGDVPSDFNGLSESKLFSQNVPMSNEFRGTFDENGVPLPPESNPQINIPAKVAKGTEDFPITQDQISRLETISKVNGMDPNMQTSVMNAITGKSAVGDLTNAEYVKVAQAMGLLDKANAFSPTMKTNVNPIGDLLSPRKNFFPSYQDATGIPVAKEVYYPIENGAQTMKIATEADKFEIRSILGKYSSLSDNSGARDLLTEYLQGNQDAILKNTTLTDVQKTELQEVATNIRAWFDKKGQVYGVDPKAYIDNYAPHVRNTGGVFQLYKDESTVPEGSSFFAKQKRTGGLTPNITDIEALMDIYSHAGARSTFMGPALERASAFYDNAPDAIKPSVKDYIQTKMGYEGKVEEWMDGVGTQLNQRLGWNLPPDLSRKMVQLTMDTTYAGAMGLNPGTYFRNLISNPTFIYAENGARFLPESIGWYFKDPAAANAELGARGFRVQTADPYGSAIANSDTQFGSLANKYRALTSWSMKGMNLSDSFGRAIAMKQSDMIFNDAIDRYNSGQLSWPQVEKALDFDGMPRADQNEIRQQLASGKREAALNHYARYKIDETQFPYRTASGGRAMNSIVGKMAFQFDSYSNNYAHMIGRWIKMGQYDKIVRFIGSQAIVYNTLLHQGMDFSRSQGVSPAVPGGSPTVKTAADLYNMIDATLKNNAQDFDTAKNDMVKEMTSLGYPGAVSANRVKAFLQSYNGGPDANGNYQVQSANGKLKYDVPFSDLFMSVFGFPSAYEKKQEDLANNESNADYKYTQTKNQIVQMIGDGNVEQATALMKKSGVYPTASEINSYMQARNLPLSMRLFQQLPKPLQAEFAPQVFGSQ